MKKIIILLFILLSVTSCGLREGVVQKAEKSYIQFTGNWENAIIQIDNLEPFVLESTYDSHSEQNKKPPLIYQLSPGKHNLKVTRDDKLLINRVLFLDSQSKMEVIVPWIDSLH